MSTDVGELVALGLLVVLMVGLLRSNADLTRRLSRLELSVERARRAPKQRSAVAPVASMTMDDRPNVAPEGDLVPIEGLTPSGVATSVDLGEPNSTLVAFLSSSCGICASIWQRLQAGELASEAADMAAVVVTKSPDLEDVEQIAELAAAGSVPTVMSTEAWDDYEVPGSPYFLVVDGQEREIVTEGSATGWGDVAAMVRSS